MSNIDIVKGILRHMIPNCNFTRENPTHVQDIAKALAGAGLLMPDLPQPDYTLADGKASWDLPCKAFVDSWHPAGSPMLFLGSDGKLGLTPTEARKLAQILLAAAQWVEKEDDE